jgi:hypothetical protein
LTDTEVITYIIDFLRRKRALSFEEIASVIAAPSGRRSNRPPKERERLTTCATRFQACLLPVRFQSWLVYRRFDGAQ